MNAKSKIYIGFGLVLGLTFLFSKLFGTSLYLAFHLFFSEIEYGYFFPSLIIIILGLIISSVFIIKTKLINRIAKNWGLTLLNIASNIVLIIISVGILAFGLGLAGIGYDTFWVWLIVVPAFMYIPLAIISFLGVMKVLLSLKLEPNRYEYFARENLAFCILSISISIILLMVTNIGKTLSLPYNLNIFVIFIITTIITSVVIYKIQLQKKIASNYGIYLLGIGLCLYFVINYFILSLSDAILLLATTDRTINDFEIKMYTVSALNDLMKLILIIGFLKVCLTLKPLETKTTNDSCYD